MLKKVLTYCGYIGLISLCNIAMAIEFPKLPEGGLTNYALKTTGTLFERIRKEGFFHLNVNWNPGRGIIGVRSGAPLLKIMQGTHYLTRIEANGLWVGPTKDSLSEEEFINLVKLGATGRCIINPAFILGGYAFFDFPLSSHSPSSNRNTRNPKQHMWNPGVELIFPQQLFTVSTDIVNPWNLCFGDYKQNFYQTSVRVSPMWPEVGEFVLAGRLAKYPGCHPQLTIMVGGKGRLPIKKWGIFKYHQIGAGITYLCPPMGDQWPDTSKWLARKNISFSVYIRLHLQPSPENTYRDFLNMPIDRWVAAPYHPDNLPKGYEFKIQEHHPAASPVSTPGNTRESSTASSPTLAPMQHLPPIQLNNYEN
jgi:hypothetical protein